MDIKLLGNQLLSAASLYSEVLMCIAAAGLLGWIVGLMMQRSRYRRSLQENNTKWEERYHSMEASSRDDAENLEEQLQSLANETKSVQTTNRALTETLKKNDTNMQKSRAEAIELNRQHTESHERLQRIIQQKDREIAELGSRPNPDIDSKKTDTHKNENSTAKIQAISASTKLADADLNDADTVAISPAQLSSDSLDDTLELSDKETADSKSKGTKGSATNPDTALDDTSDLNDMGLEESTIAMDEEALAFAQRSYKGRSND